MLLPHITGIKNNTRIIADAPFTSARHTPTSRVLKIIPTLLGALTISL